MAGHDNTPKHDHGRMDVSAQEKTFAGFIRLATWAGIAIVVVLIFLALAGA